MIFPTAPVDGNVFTVSLPTEQIFNSYIYVASKNCWFPYTAPDITYVPFGVVTASVTGNSSYKVLSLSEGPIQSITLRASIPCEISTPYPVYGESFKLLVKQPAATGNGTVTWFGVVWSGGITPTLTATAGRADLFTFTSDGSKWYGEVKQNYIW